MSNTLDGKKEKSEMNNVSAPVGKKVIPLLLTILLNAIYPIDRFYKMEAVRVVNQLVLPA